MARLQSADEPQFKQTKNKLSSDGTAPIQRSAALLDAGVSNRPLSSTEAKRPTRALSPVRGLNRKGVDHPLKSANLDAKKANAVHVPIVAVETAVDEPVNKGPPESVTQLPTDEQSQPLQDMAKTVEDTADEPVNKDPPESVTQLPTDVQSQPLQDVEKTVEDTADVPAKKDSPPRIILMFPEGTLGTEIPSQPLEDLSKAFEGMVEKMAKRTTTSVNINHFIDQINSVTAEVSEFSERAQALLDAARNVSSKLKETIDGVVAAIDVIASAHPILKISWFIVSVGYKIISDASEVDKDYWELQRQFQPVLEYVTDFLRLPIKGIAHEKERSKLVRASESIIIWVKDAAVLFTEYLDTPRTTLSNISGPNKNKLNEMKKRLADVQEAHKSAMDNGLFTLAVTTASNVVDIKVGVE
ncbi:hypothetical protein BJ741DRAFT_659482, partial [Chytriomyces cf. hyalinus JEL632]